MDQKSLNVLIVEDNPGDLRLVREYLKDSPTSVFGMEHAGRLSEAMEILSKRAFDVLLLDLDLPDSSGFGGLERITAAHPALPVIVLTGQEDDVLGLSALQKGAGDYLVKGRVNETVLSRSIRYSVERKRSEAVLRESENRLSRAQEMAHLGSWELDLVNNRLAWSDEVYRIFGLEPQEFAATYEAFLAAVHPDDRAAVDAAYSDSLRAGMDCYDIEHRVVRKPAGEVRIVHERCTHVRDASGAVVRSLGMVHDITERKAAETALQRERDNLQKIFDSVSVGMLLLDEKGNVTRVNRTVTGWLGVNGVAAAGAQPGNVLGCIHVVNDPAVCGRTAACRECSIRGAFEAVLSTGKPILGLEAMADLSPGGNRVKLWLEVNAGPIAIDGKKCAVISLNDITKRKLSEEALKLSEAKFSALYASMIEGVALHELVYDGAGKAVDYRITDVNPAYERITGIKPSEAVGKLASDLYATGSPPYLDVYAGVASTGKPVSFEVDFAPMAKYFYVSVFSPGKGRFVTVFQDITDRKKREEELKQLNRTLSAHNSSAQAMTHAEDETVYLNRICGIIVEKCGHAMVWIGFAEDDKELTVRPVAQAGFEEGYLETLKVTWSDTERGRGPTGTAIRTGKPSVCRNMITDPVFAPWRAEAVKRGYASSLVLPLKEGGRAFGAVSIYSRVPDAFSEEEIKLLGELADDLAYGLLALRSNRARLKAEKELRETSEYLEKLISYANAPIICWNESFKVTRFNRASERLTSYAAGDVIGEDLAALFPEKSRSGSLRRIRRTLRGEPLETVEIPIKRKDGVIRTVLWNSANIYEADGRTLSATIAQGQDITERKEAELVLKRDKDELERLVEQRSGELMEAQADLNRAKRLSDIGLLSATVAHELRNPLAAINLAASNIRRKAKDSGIFDSHLNNIEKKVLESDQIISNLLFYSRIKPPSYEKTDLAGILEECSRCVLGRRKKGLVIKKKLAPIKDVGMDADPVQLKELFNNLLNNACDAVPESKGVIEVEAEAGPEFLTVRVRDNGPGFEAEHLKRVFEPFFTTKAKGTGLGLAVCRQITVLHGGAIKIDSVPGKGAAVEVKLPRTAVKAGAGAA